MSELLQYLIDPGDLLRAEAEALFAGIVLDTKNFTMRTGGRTFEAAALLRAWAWTRRTCSACFRERFPT